MLRSRLAPHAGDAREAGVWLGSRLTNGLLGLVHVSLVAAAIGPDEAGRFFFLWTAVWLLATVLRFGMEGVLPRIIAEALRDGTEVPSLRRAALAGLAASAVALVPLMAVFRVPISGETIGLSVALAALWAGTFVLSAALKAYGKVGLSGIVSQTVWPVGPALAPLFLLGRHAGWKELAAVTVATTALSFTAACVVTARALGRQALRRLASRRGSAVPLEADVLGAALLSLLYELLLWLPVVTIALANVRGAVAAGIYAAVRVTGLVSWPYNAVVALLTPRIAQSLAARDLTSARRTIARGGLIGLAVTLPMAVVVALAARPILDLFDPAYGALATALVLLVAGRVFDAAAGPVGEALLVGRATWIDCALVGTGVTVGLAVGLGLEGAVGAAKGAGIAGSTAFALANLLRLGVVTRLLRHGWDLRAVMPDRRRGGALAAVLLAGGIAFAVAVQIAGPDTRDFVWLGVGASLAVAAGAVGLGAARHGLRATVASPIGVLGLLLVTHFALRPATLVLDPGSAVWAVRTLGFNWIDVTHAAVLGAAGFGVLAAGFLITWRPVAAPRVVPALATSRVLVAVGGALVVGSALWLILFRRLGGPSALENDPSKVHLSQFGAGYGTVGLALCLGALLVALQAWLARPARSWPLMAAVAVAAIVAAAGTVALATRGLAVATALAALVLVFQARRPRPRTVVVSVLCVVLLGAGAVFLRAVRDYSQYQSTGGAITSVTQTPPLRLLGPDLIEFDHLVILENLVPGKLGWLNGSSLADVPKAFVPRKIWPNKPKPVDFRLSQELWGVPVAAGNPFTLPGEMWWNLRFPGALAALLVIGLLGGWLWRFLLARCRAAGELMAAVLTGYSYLIFTRPLAAMLLTTAIAAFTALAVHLAASVGLRPALARLPAFVPRGLRRA